MVMSDAGRNRAEIIQHYDFDHEAVCPDSPQCGKSGDTAVSVQGIPRQTERPYTPAAKSLSSVEISKTGIKGFERYAKKYGIDYAIRKDSSEVPPKYLVFFKAPDAEAFQSAFKEYSASLLSKSKRPSVLAKLHELVQAAAELPGKVRHKEQERGL